MTYHARAGWVIGALWLAGLPAGAALQANLTNAAGTYADAITIRGLSFNNVAEGALVDGGLQAYYYRQADGKNVLGTAFTVPDAPQAGELASGRNSEFVAAPTGSGWWITDNAAFRTANGIPGTATGDSVPAFIARKQFNQLTSAADDNPTNQFNNFVLRLEGKLSLPADTTYQFNGSGDDVVRVWVDGRLVSDDNVNPGTIGPTTLKAGVHGIVAQFVEYGGGQYYGFGQPPGSTFKAVPQDTHVYSGYSLDYGTTYAKRRPSMLTLKTYANFDGSGAQLGNTVYFKGMSSGNYANDLGPSPVTDSYRMRMAGYWYVPATDSYTFGAWGDDNGRVYISDNPNDDPWALGAGNLTANGAWGSAVTLTQGWRPIRLEFGEGGGGANWGAQWNRNGAGAQWFMPSQFMSTADSVYDWMPIDLSGNQIPTAADLYTWSFPRDLLGNTFDLRLTTADTAGNTVQSMVSIIGIPEPATLGLLALGALALTARRRASR